MDFAAEAQLLAADLQAASAITVVWKDADRAWGPLLPLALAQHRNRHCRAVKASTGNLARCIAADDLTAAAWPRSAAPRIRTCPFGVTEVLAPVWCAGIYQGFLMLGPWHRSPDRRPGLTPFPGAARALAIARVAAAAFSELCQRRAAALAAARAEQAGDALMATAVAWIDAHLSANIAARQVAAQVNLSPSRFIHRFKEATGVAFGPHLRSRLMSEAARQLADPTLSIAAVSTALGFANPNWFATAFRKHYGMTPSAWRLRLPQG
jgi:AraC-like DNA-binding protein